MIYYLLWWFSYNPLERREACKGGKDASKKCPSQSSTKGSTAAPKAQSSHNVRRNDAPSVVNFSNQSVKASKPPAPVPAYDEQV